MSMRWFFLGFSLVFFFTPNNSDAKNAVMDFFGSVGEFFTEDVPGIFDSSTDALARQERLMDESIGRDAKSFGEAAVEVTRSLDRIGNTNDKVDAALGDFERDLEKAKAKRKEVEKRIDELEDLDDPSPENVRELKSRNAELASIDTSIKQGEKYLDQLKEAQKKYVDRLDDLSEQNDRILDKAAQKYGVQDRSALTADLGRAGNAKSSNEQKSAKDKLASGVEPTIAEFKQEQKIDKLREHFRQVFDDARDNLIETNLLFTDLQLLKAQNITDDAQKLLVEQAKVSVDKTVMGKVVEKKIKEILVDACSSKEVWASCMSGDAAKLNELLNAKGVGEVSVSDQNSKSGADTVRNPTPRLPTMHVEKVEE